ncbi:BMP family protein [Leptothermofonsia sichuanensis E412]|uniref:BMP family protein n=1 Tax=Leptothermofonsia sichuanensis TaxID=2917832 RepID=UPI001CA6DED4|nr:BMP family protein [Leptothermofonsia sichuanensis]QZZ22578.1 BMP family protein [Leptothermofonsia sichuanensis E412]
MNRLIGLFRSSTLAVLAGLMVSCNGIETEPDRALASNFKVAAVLPTEVNDQALSESAYQGLKLIEKQLVAKTAYTSQVADLPVTQMRNIFSQYAEQGFDFVIGKSETYISAVEAIAQQFPRTKFAIVAAYPGNNFNVGSLSFRDGELGYLCGVVAALKSTTGQIAFIGDVDLPASRKVALLFERGARSVQSGITVRTQWIGNPNPTRAKEVAQRQIREGSDVLLVRTEQMDEVIHQAAGELNTYTVGWGKDWYDVAPGTVLTSGIQRLPELLLQGASLVRLGRWEGKPYRFGLREGVQDLAPFRGALTPEEARTVQQVKEDILTGKVDVSL